MKNIIFNPETGIVTEEPLYYAIAWYEDLGAGMIHLGLERAQSSVIKFYQAGDCSVNDVPMDTLPELLAALGNPPLLTRPEG